MHDPTLPRQAGLAKIKAIIGGEGAPVRSVISV
jgi:hypothetical protein